MNTKSTAENPADSQSDSGSPKTNSKLPDRSSTALQKVPHLTSRNLTTMLLVMCFVPVVTIVVLWRIMPPVYEGELKASVSTIGLPPPEFYEPHYSKRPEWNTGELVVKNESDQDWTHLNIRVNRHYQIYDTETIPAHGERKYTLNRFVSRTGARFQLRYNPLKTVRVYARRPTKDRATYSHEFAQIDP